MSRPHRFRSMGCEVLVAGAGPAELRAIEELFAERDRVFSRFRAGSELNAVNRAAGRPVLVSPLFAATVELALDMAAETGGLVDPTLGAAILAAGYDRDFDELDRDGPEPASNSLLQARPGSGAPRTIPRNGSEPASDSLLQGRWREVRLAGRLLTVPPGVLLDLNGVVKAKAVDDAVALLPGEGWVSAGGDIAARGELTVALPGGESVRLLEGALATSGSSRRRWLRGGRVLHHLIDPFAGAPADTPWEQVTACGRTCVVADVAAKAGFIAGPEWLEARGIPAWFVPRGEPVCT